MWRPENWLPSPCENCDNKVEDSYGLFCDITCGKATAYANQEIGADSILKALKQYGQYQKCIDQWDNERPFETGIGWLVFIPDEED